MQKFRANRVQNTLQTIRVALSQPATVAQSYSDYILDLQPALFGIAAYVRKTQGAKEQSEIILLNLISSRPSTESPRYGTTNQSNVDSPLKNIL